MSENEYICSKLGTVQSMKYTILSLMLALSLTTAWGQKYVEVADQAFASSEYLKAINLYKSAYSKLNEDATLKARIAFNTGYCYRRLGKPDHAELWLNKAAELHHQDPLLYLYYADALRQNSKYDDAVEQYEKYKKFVSSDERAEKGIKSCQLAKKWTDNPTPYKVVNVVYLNSENSDYAPVFADSLGQSLIFTSSREGATGDRQHGATGQPFADLYTSRIDQTGRWSVPVALDFNVNTIHEEGAACFNSDFSTLIFTRCSFSDRKESTCEVYVAPRLEDTWDKPDHFKVSDFKKDTFLVAHPSLSADGLKLYFVSDMASGFGGYDIWYVERPTRDEKWSTTPVNAGATINSKGNELYPYIRKDGTLFFASDGHLGMGGLDLFRVNKDAKGQDQLLNLMYPINSPMDDFGITFYPNEEKGFFSSNRPGTVGFDDIYQFSLPPLEFSTEGAVVDELTSAPMPDVKLRLIGSDGTSVEATTDKNGKYSFDLRPSTNYIVIASKKGYLNGKGKLTTDGVEASKTFNADVYMTTIDIPVEIPNVMYDVAKWELRPESIVSLEKLVDVLLDNPTITVEVSSHTDFRVGRISNMDLSQKRAQAVVDFLIAKGIDRERLSAKGYGETRPKTVTKKQAFQYSFLKEGTVLTEAYIKSLPAELQETAHQINRRTEFQVLSTNYQE